MTTSSPIPPADRDVGGIPEDAPTDAAGTPSPDDGVALTTDEDVQQDDQPIKTDNA